MKRKSVPSVVVAGIVAVGVIGLVVALVMLFGGGKSEAPSDAKGAATSSAAPSVEASPTEQEEPEQTEPSMETTYVEGVGEVEVASNISEDEARKELQAFVDAYAEPSLEQDEWLASLEQWTEPGLKATLRTSSRQIAKQSAGQISEIEFSDGWPSWAVVNSRAGKYWIAFIVEPNEDDWDDPRDYFVTVKGIDYEQAPSKAKLPLGSSVRMRESQLAKQLELAYITTYAQPGGQTDEQRLELIRKTFKAPVHAQKIPRTAQPDQPMRVSPIRMSEVAYEDPGTGELVALVAFRYFPEGAAGTQQEQFMQIRVRLERQADGTWALIDAEQASH
ncbi:hypothetical protein DHOM_04950 [Dermabacter hominis 1368]|uniref:Uncharacterized protein n=2 Tax=Dermabacter TaxID=36739 RepID=A0A1B0ZJ78_9MICO|nr:hypothetical protein [Dermabacter vaginalis]ANP27960.1 hypothetical protein DAD186_14100 [Dermabacter vaginalis]KDS93566.1 hypothetical protein DHOM_04950 [Dermabacter hominis 1368]